MRLLIALLPIFLLLGCGSTPRIALNNQQTVIMESPVLTAGVIPGKPMLLEENGRKKAIMTLSNSQPKSIQLHYRFYWYDKQGLDLLPFTGAKTVILPANSDVKIDALNDNLDAYSVRVYLYL